MDKVILDIYMSFVKCELKLFKKNGTWYFNKNYHGDYILKEYYENDTTSNLIVKYLNRKLYEY